MKYRFILIVTFVLAGLYIFTLEPNKISDINVVQNKQSTELIVVQTKNEEPIIAYNDKENCWILDFSRSILSESIYKKTIAAKFLKMAYVSKLNYRHNTARLRLFLEPNSFFKITRDNHKVKIKIARKKLNYKKYISQKIHLQNPSDRHLSPVFIDLKDQPLAPIINKLAENIGVKLLIRNKLPQKVSLKLEASNSSEALAGISELLGIEISKTGQIWALRKASENNYE